MTDLEEFIKSAPSNVTERNIIVTAYAHKALPYLSRHGATALRAFVRALREF
jgi:hypothetical protein